MTRKAVGYGVLLLILSLGAYWALHKHDKKVQAAIAAPALKPQDEAKIVIDPVHHTFTTVRRVGSGQSVKQTFLPSRKTSVLIEKNGEINVQTQVYGTECAPFIGAAFSDAPRLVLGANVFYWRKLDLGVGLSGSFQHRPNLRAFVSLSYNVYSNTSLFVGVQNDMTPIGGVSVKF